MNSKKAARLILSFLLFVGFSFCFSNDVLGADECEAPKKCVSVLLGNCEIEGSLEETMWCNGPGTSSFVCCVKLKDPSDEGKCKLSPPQGFCQSFWQTGCTGDTEMNSKFSYEEGWGIGCGFAVFPKKCCYPKNDVPWYSGYTCLGTEGCLADGSCKTLYVEPAGILPDLPHSFDTCDQYGSNYTCCEEKYRREKAFGETCSYRDTTSYERTGVCIQNVANCEVGKSGGGNCANNLTCCSDLKKSCTSLGGSCIGVLDDCVGIVERETDCLNNPDNISCCIPANAISCDDAQLVCEQVSTCPANNRVPEFGCGGSGLICCNKGLETCQDFGGVCSAGGCGNGTPVFDLNIFDPCYIHFGNLLTCCSGTYSTCLSQGGVVSPNGCLGGYVPASDTPYCCLLNNPHIEPQKPKDLVYRGPVIEKLEQVLGPVTKMLYYGGLGIGVFYIILAGYKLMVSEGDPQRTKAAQEQLTSAVIGIIFILLSVTIIRVIIDEIIKV